MGEGILEDLEGDGEQDGADHHADAENDVLGVADGSVGDVGPGELLDVRGTLGTGHMVGPEDAPQPHDHPQQGEHAGLEAEAGVFEGFGGLGLLGDEVLAGAV